MSALNPRGNIYATSAVFLVRCGVLSASGVGVRWVSLALSAGRPKGVPSIPPHPQGQRTGLLARRLIFSYVQSAKQDILPTMFGRCL